ncbi:hypothetical protein LIER_22355 [Lithospermum erythrorhizon]|uniref:Uncharacterized protein n=1 Tax=Lithospermum erythrorhizon TaxID=34254 RepID=A0AAV3QV60_LITER
MEIKLWKQEWESITYKLKMPNSLLVDARGRKGAIALLWPQDLNITIKSYSSHHIEAWVEDDGNNPWRFVWFYGHHEVKNRRLSWELLKFINNKSDLPTVLLGDFKSS